MPDSYQALVLRNEPNPISGHLTISFPSWSRGSKRVVAHGCMKFGRDLTVSCWSDSVLAGVNGARSARIKPVRPALILAYPGQTASATLIRDLPLHLALKKAGHRIQVLEDPTGLENALKAEKYDLVVADVANANELSQRVFSAPSKPVLLPVAFQASKEEQSAAQKKYHCLLKAPSNAENYLLAIDQAMDWKLKTTNR